MKPNHPVPFRLLGPASVRALSIFALLCAASQAQAASSTWTSTSDTAFNTAGNWSLGVPCGTAANTDAANFTSTATGIQTSVNLSSSDTVQTVSFASGQRSGDVFTHRVELRADLGDAYGHGNADPARP